MCINECDGKCDSYLCVLVGVKNSITAVVCVFVSAVVCEFQLLSASFSCCMRVSTVVCVHVSAGVYVTRQRADVPDCCRSAGAHQ